MNTVGSVCIWSAVQKFRRVLKDRGHLIKFKLLRRVRSEEKGTIATFISSAAD